MKEDMREQRVKKNSLLPWRRMPISFFAMFVFPSLMSHKPSSSIETVSYVSFFFMNPFVCNPPSSRQMSQEVIPKSQVCQFKRHLQTLQTQILPKKDESGGNIIKMYVLFRRKKRLEGTGVIFDERIVCSQVFLFLRQSWGRNRFTCEANRHTHRDYSSTFGIVFLISCLSVMAS